MTTKKVSPGTQSMEICPDRETAMALNKEIDNTASFKRILKGEENKIKNATLENVYNTVGKYLHINDTKRIDVILATAISNQILGTPIWMFIVGDSGDWKSAFVRSLEGCKNVLKLDQITKNSLASGMKDVPDVGQELNQSSTILLFPDLAYLTSLNKDEKNLIWGQFRNLYDGFIEKRVGSGVHKKYDGCHVTLIACTTSVIRDEYLIHAQLGTRELMYDTVADSADDDNKMDMAWDNEEIEEEMIREMHNCVHDFLTYNKVKNVTISSETKAFLKAECKRLKILRASGPVDRRYKELLHPIHSEVPTRLIKQLKRIYRCLMSLSDDYSEKRAREIITHIVDSSGDTIRQTILTILKEKREWIKIADIQQSTRLSRVTVKAQLETLWNLRIGVEKKTEDEQVGGYVTSDREGYEVKRGGRYENVAYYKFSE